MKPSSLNCVYFLLFLLTGVLSCTDRQEDHSLPINAYKELGIPDPGRKWDMEDYTQARNVLTRLKWERPFELPMKDSEKSGILFDHMISLEYLSFLQDSTLSLNAKAEKISEFVNVYDHWMDVYTVPMLKQTPYQREILDFHIFNIRLMEAMVKLMHQINKSDDPADVGLQYGHKFIIGNYLTSLHTTLQTQNSTADFLKPDLERMADSIYASVMRNKEWMDSSIRNELNHSLRSVIDSSASDYIRNKYRNLMEALTVPDDGIQMNIQ